MSLVAELVLDMNREIFMFMAIEEFVGSLYFFGERIMYSMVISSDECDVSKDTASRTECFQRTDQMEIMLASRTDICWDSTRV